MVTADIFVDLVRNIYSVSFFFIRHSFALIVLTA